MPLTPSRRSLALALSAAATIAGAMALSPAQAATPAPEPADARGIDTLAAGLQRDLGRARSAGSYLENGRLVITVTDRAAAAAVRARGAVPVPVGRSGAELDRAVAVLGRDARIAGTAWAIDPVSNQVVVSADATVTGTRMAALTRTARSLGAAVRVERIPGELSPTASGGDAVYFGSSRCSLGFNVTKDSTYYFLDAGHCGNAAKTWYADKSKTRVLGDTVNSSFPGNDFALVRYRGGDTPPGDVSTGGGTHQDIVSAGDPVVGQTVTRSGSTSGVRTGKVTALNATANYAQGSVTGLIKTSVCAQKGDSGGPLFSGTTAYGIASGSNLSCGSDSVSYYQPVTEALQHYGVELY
ncbi:S1 family peptidase [Streptomyces sp. NPDC046887]|uniref:S1 family peptidase n=1 Tax=Streptomyces sp. NPDC046887 TaxID=3155472 RepID=UPI0033D45AAE